MFGFMKKNDNVIVLNQKLGRLLNQYSKADMEERQNRAETRLRLALPCLIFLNSEAAAPKSYATGVTSDISLHGLALITHDHLESNEYILAFGPQSERLFIVATCRRFLKDQFNMNTAAFSFNRFMQGKEITPIADAIAAIEQTTQGPLALPNSLQQAEDAVGQLLDM